MATKKGSKVSRKPKTTARPKPAKRAGAKAATAKATAKKPAPKPPPMRVKSESKPRIPPPPTQGPESRGEGKPVARSCIEIVHGGLAALRLRLEAGSATVSYRGTKGRQREVDSLLAELAADYGRTLGKLGRK